MATTHPGLMGPNRQNGWISVVDTSGTRNEINMRHVVNVICVADTIYIKFAASPLVAIPNTDGARIQIVAAMGELS